MYVGISMWRPEVFVKRFPHFSSPRYVLRQDLSLDLELTSWSDWSAGLRDSPVLTFLMLESWMQAAMHTYPPPPHTHTSFLNFMLCVWAFCPNVCMCTLCVFRAWWGYKRVSNPLELSAWTSWHIRHWDSGLIFLRQALYWLSHLHSPTFLIFILQFVLIFHFERLKSADTFASRYS